jgi:hypothetical protein
MGLLKKCQPCMWEGATLVDLLEAFAPWAKEDCTSQPAVTGIPVTLLGLAGGAMECTPISEEHPLGRTSHFMGACVMPAAAVAEGICGFEAFYASLGLAVLPTVMEGDCGLDVMCLMLGLTQSLDAREALRIELSDYLISRTGKQWMHDLMAALQELEWEDVTLSQSGGTAIPACPIAPAPPVAEPAETSAESEVIQPDGNTFKAMRWASQLQDDGSVLSLIHSLPKEIVEEQVVLYGKRAETAVAAAALKKDKILFCTNTPWSRQMQVAARFHKFCESRCIVVEKRMPYGAMKTFIKDNITWQSKQKKIQAKQIRSWYDSWRASPSNVAATVEDDSEKKSSERSALRSRAPKRDFERLRAHGAGRKFNAPLIRQALYEWFVSIRYAIDWNAMIENRRSRGKKSWPVFLVQS